MSELNVYHHELRPGEYDEFYLKYEADRVIADLEKSHKMEVELLLIEIAELIKKNERLANKDKIMASETIKDLYKEIKHHKYKRCVDKVELCETKLAYYITSCDRYDSKYVNKKAKHFYKWKYKWLELAEKFKEAK